MSSSTATLAIGAVTVINGIIGTACGAMILNKLMARYEVMLQQGSITSEILEKYRIEKACKIMFIGMFLGFVLAVLGIAISVMFPGSKGFLCFIIVVGLGEFFLFITIPPTAMAIMHCVPKHLRAQANAVSANIVNILGSIPSPAVIGAWFQAFGYYVGMVLTAAWLVFAVLLWAFGWYIAVSCI